MKRKINAAKKGMVLILTSIMLFVATSIVAVLSSFVIVTRNAKINLEYISRTQIALKSKSYELFNKVILNKLITITNPKYDDPITTFTVTTADLLTSNVNFNDAIVVTLFENKYDSSEAYYEYSIDSTNLTESDMLISEIRDVGLTTTVVFKKNSNLSNKSSYKIGEMRFY